MNNDERMYIFNKWYNNPEVKFNIIRFTKNREFALLMPKYVTEDLKKCSTRMLKCHSVQHFDFIMKILNVYRYKRPFNLYYTIAEYKNGIPNQDIIHLNLRNNKGWTKDHYKEMVAYDYFIDIDSPSFTDMDYTFESAKELKRLFDTLKVPYTLTFSGMGFHFKIPYKYLPKEYSLNPLDDENIFKVLSKITEELYNIVSELIDCSIYDSRRLCKIPYTLAQYEEKIMVCCPINSNEQFNNFDFENYEVKNFCPIFPRIDTIFNEDGNFNNLYDYIQTNKGYEND